MKSKTIFIAIALVLAISGSAALYNILKDRTPRPDPLGEPPVSDAGDVPPDTQDDERIKAPDFTVVDQEGNLVNLSDLLGKPTVLNFWASWCSPCKMEMPEFNKVYEELGDEVQFIMVDAVDGDRETKETGEAYIAEQGFSFPVYYDTMQDAIVQYAVRAFPTSLFIDSDGYVVAGVEGAIDEAILRKGIAKIAETTETEEE